MFYCSWSVNIPLHELNVQPGQYVALSEWRTTDDLCVNQIAYASDAFSALSATRPMPEWGSERAFTSNPGTQLVARFLAKLFTSRPHNQLRVGRFADKHQLADTRAPDIYSAPFSASMIHGRGQVRRADCRAAVKNPLKDISGRSRSAPTARRGDRAGTIGVGALMLCRRKIWQLTKFGAMFGQFAAEMLIPDVRIRKTNCI